MNTHSDLQRDIGKLLAQRPGNDSAMEDRMKEALQRLQRGVTVRVFPTLEGIAWALSISQSENIFVFGAGLYSFFVDYTQECLDTWSCQTQIVNVESAGNTNIAIFQLSTVATTNQLSVDGVGVISQADNRNGFASTATVWTL